MCSAADSPGSSSEDSSGDPRRLFTFEFLSLPRLHPSSNEKALLLRSVRWHTIQAHAEKGLAGLLVAMPVAA